MEGDKKESQLWPHEGLVTEASHPVLAAQNVPLFLLLGQAPCMKTLQGEEIVFWCQDHPPPTKWNFGVALPNSATIPKYQIGTLVVALWIVFLAGLGA